MAGDHAKLSPSASKVWMTCHGQPTVVAGMDDSSGPDALRGTMAHAALQQCLDNGFDAKDFIGSRVRDYEGKDAAGKTVRLNFAAFDTVDAEAVQKAVDFIREEVDEACGDEFGVEEKLVYNEDLWGTVDFWRYRPSTQELLVVDYKHGVGVAVDAKDNPQGVSYALMKTKALKNRGVSQVRFVIVQPRGFHDEGQIRDFIVAGVDMLDWEDLIVEAIESCRQAELEFTQALPVPWWTKWLHSGEYCRKNFCKNQPHCPRLKDDARRATEMDFAPVAEATKKGQPVGYDLDALAASLALVDRVRGWAKAVDEFAYAEAVRGIKIPNNKLVAKKATARWLDPKAVEEAMDLQGFETSETHEPAELKSPAQLRAVLEPVMPGKTKKAREAAAKAALDEFTSYVSSGSVLVADDDPRPPIRSSAADDFAAVE